jgi:putative SOS response-associated peptidase YedK
MIPAMCGRYTLIKLEQVLANFPAVLLPPGLVPRYNIAPTQPVLVLPNDHPKLFERVHWGLVPSWAKDPSIGSRMINARAETLDEKPVFRTALRRRRCLVPADGFYEWRKEPKGGKTPMYIRMKTGEPFAFAGLWDEWHSPDGSVLRSCTVITTSPNDLMKPIHDRMPAILPREDYPRWLAKEEQPPEKMAELLGPYPAEEMEAYPVSRLVNRPANDVADCIKRAEESGKPEDQGHLWGSEESQD